MIETDEVPAENINLVDMTQTENKIEWKVRHVSPLKIKIERSQLYGDMFTEYRAMIFLVVVLFLIGKIFLFFMLRKAYSIWRNCRGENDLKYTRIKV